MTVLFYFLAILAGYLMGCVHMAFYLGRRRGVDLRKHGTGNLGASNAMIVLGWKEAVLVGVHDIGKALLAVLLARWLLPDLPLIGACAGVACVLGHIFPFQLRFRGGKGLASYLGMSLALNWKLTLAVLVLVAVVTLLSDYIVVGTMTAAAAVPLGFAFRGEWMLAALLCAASLVIVSRHRDNFARLRSGTEVGLRRANRGEGRVKNDGGPTE